MSKLLKFYRGEATDSEGRTFDEILAWDDDDLEAVHDYIQWLFPTPTPSAYNPDAPLLSADDIAAFRANAALRNRLRQAFERYLRFAGLAIDADGRVVEAANFAQRSPEVWQYANHNWLRVSRVLASLRLLGLEAEARAFFAWLEARVRDGVIGSADASSREEAVGSCRQWAKHAKD
jgi:hypothetical protein